MKDLTLSCPWLRTLRIVWHQILKDAKKRANALKNITIPMYTNLVHNINNALEEKERENSPD